MQKHFGVHILVLSLNRYNIFSDVEILSKNWNFVSTPWTIKIPLGNSVGDHICYTNPFGWVTIFFTPKDHFSDNLVKKLDSGWSSQRKYSVFPTYP